MIAPIAPDPWAVTDAAPTAPLRALPHRRIAEPLLAALLACAAPVVRVWSHGATARLGSVVLAAAVLCWSAALQLRSVRARVGLATVAAAVGAVAAHRTIGAAAALVGFVAAAVVHAALGPADGARSRLVAARLVPTRPTALALPFLIAAAVAWYRTQRPALSLGLLAAASFVIVAAARRPVAAERLDHAVRRATVGVSGAIGAAIAFIVALPVLYLPGAIVRAATRPVRARRARSTWSAQASGVSTTRRDSVRPFATAEGRLRRRHLAALALVVVAFGAATFVVTRPDEPEATWGPDSDFRPADEWPAAEGLDYAQELIAEQSALPLPRGSEAGYVLGDLSTRYTNTAGGERRTALPPDCDCPEGLVWLTGGSAAFGIGQRDEHTIASELVGLAAADGVRADVRNVAVPGYTLWQEYRSILARLESGAAAPDLVVFYDGFNDVLNSLNQTVVDGPAWDEPVIGGDAALQEYLDLGPVTARSRVDDLGGPDELGRRIAERYDALRARVAADLADRGIPTSFFFQPDALADPVQRAASLRFSVRMNEDVAANLGPVFDAVSERVGGDVVNLRDVFDGSDRPVFFDVAHTNEAGAKIVAAAMYDRLGSVPGWPRT